MSFFTPDTSDIESYYDRGHFLLAWRICIAFSIIFIIVGILYTVANPIGLIPVSAVLTVTFTGFVYLKKTRNVRPVFWIFAAGGTIISNFAMNTILDYTHYVDFLWLVTCVLIAFIGLGKKEGVFFILLNCLGIAYFFWFTLNKHIEVLPTRTSLEITGDFIEVVFAFLVIAYLLQQFVQFQKHAESELKRVNQDLEVQNNLITTKSNENETLVKEIHHRVKNNLQIIISLLRMQSNEMKSKEGETQFNEAINRIMAMSLIHEKLYAKKNFSKINLKSYIEELTEDIVSASTIIQQNVTLQIDVEIEEMELNTIVPLGLLINELVSNSLKHAMLNNDGKIEISIKKIGIVYQLTYKDNGNWIEPDPTQSSFGIELIDILAEQMNGEKTLTTVNGTQYLFLLKDV